MGYCVIIANGNAPDSETAHQHAAQAELLLAADGGARHALALGLVPHVVIGDIDSLDDGAQELLRAGCKEVPKSLMFSAPAERLVSLRWG